MTVIPERLAQLDTLTLDQGDHTTFDDGHCAMEVVAWLAGEGNTDAPACASPVLRRYTIALNDRWDTERRQTLKPYLPRMVGTGGDGKDDARVRVATRFLCTDLLGPWLRLAGMDEHADSLAALTAATPAEIRAFLYQVRDEAWTRRRESLDAIKTKAIAEVSNRVVDYDDAMQALAQHLRLRITAVRPAFLAIQHWNDKKQRTKAEVLAALRETAETVTAP